MRETERMKGTESLVRMGWKWTQALGQAEKDRNV